MTIFGKICQFYCCIYKNYDWKKKKTTNKQKLLFGVCMRWTHWLTFTDKAHENETVLDFNI